MPELSVVIPCYNGGALIERSVDELSQHLASGGRSWEIVLVDDGSTDGTGEIMDRIADDPAIVAVRLPANRGKGHAVAEGMAVARGACRVFTDVDLPYRLDAIDRCAEQVLDRGAHAVFGNRLLADSESSAQPRLRRWAGRVVRWAMGSILGRTDVDTQCGLKAFSGELAEVLFPMLQIEGFLFDAEATLLLTRAGLPISFVPVELRGHTASTVGFLKTGISTVREAWSIGRIGRQRLDLTGLRALSGA